VDLVRAADVARGTLRVDRVRRVEVGAARRVVEQDDRANDDLGAGRAVVVVAIRQEAGRVRVVDADEPDDVAVVADDRIAVERMSRTGCVAEVVACDVGAGARRRSGLTTVRVRFRPAVLSENRSELPPIRSSWPWFPKITSLPPPPST
jgi:hypothetical protein